MSLTMWRLTAVLGWLGLAMALVVFAAVAGFASQACTTPAGPVGGVPAALVPVFEAAASRYGLGSEGAAILAAINYVESDFGRSTLPGVRSGANSAGAAGPMQIGIGGAAGDTWDAVKVAAPDGPPGHAPDVYNEADAVYSAAHYLASNGMTGDPATWQRAVFAYNHAGWYVSEVLSRAQRYYQQGLGAAGATAASWPGQQQCSLQAGGYANPFAGVPRSHLVPERIDMGVDYADNSPDPILAIGDALINYAGPDPGWMNGNSVNYTLTDGPYAGRYIYVAESVTPTVRTGQRVVAGQQIATFGEPNTHGIETGWAAGPGLVVARASTLGQQSPGDPGANRSYCGDAFSALLAKLGAPPGLAEGRPVIGSGC